MKFDVPAKIFGLETSKSIQGTSTYYFHDICITLLKITFCGDAKENLFTANLKLDFGHLIVFVVLYMCIHRYKK